LVPKTVGPRIADLMREGLVEATGTTENDRGRKVKLYARVPPERVDEARARGASRHRRKPPRAFDLNTRKRFVRELFKDRDLLEALAAEEAADRAEARARKAAREELRARERLAEELRRRERDSAKADDPHLPFWRAWREFTYGADAARVLAKMLERDYELAREGSAPFVAAGHWADGIRHTTDMLKVSGRLYEAMRRAFGLPRTDCPACGSAAPAEEEAEVIEGELVDELVELASGDD
jgi:hypothetical protein